MQKRTAMQIYYYRKINLNMEKKIEKYTARHYGKRKGKIAISNKNLQESHERCHVAHIEALQGDAYVFIKSK